MGGGIVTDAKMADICSLCPEGRFGVEDGHGRTGEHGRDQNAM
jgi:hypothetical protein